MIRPAAISFFVLASLFLSACITFNADEYPINPVIKLSSVEKVKSFEGFDSINVTISFTDGDGDLGLGQGDTFPPYNSTGLHYYNWIMKYYRKIDGKFEEIPLDPPLNGRLPRIPVIGVRQALKGEIKRAIIVDPLTPPKDTVRYSISIIDRALHQSNEVFTDDLIVN